MKTTHVEELFTVINESAVILQEELKCSYMEALAETGDNLFHHSILQEIESEWTSRRLKKMYEGLRFEQYSKEDIRKSFQLCILKGMRENVQPNHQMTPDSIGILVGYLLNKFMKQPAYRLLDPAVGTGNLLTAAMNQGLHRNIEGIGVEIDDLLLKLAYINANLQEHPIDFYHQDSLEQLFLENVDAVICDLPIGYYPNDIRAKDFELQADEGHSYAHHLFMEQSVLHVKPGGYLFFIIPNGLFESDQAKKLQAYFKETVYIQGLLELPETLFKNKNAGKSILILQKKAINVTPPKEALLVKLPSLSNGPQIEKILSSIDLWMTQNK